MLNFKEELLELEGEGLKRVLRARDGSEAIINFSSNDYLGLSRHPEVVKAATQAVEKFGTGAIASRLLSGTLSLHQQLEKRLAKFLGFEAALVFSSGYHVNMGILPTLAESGDVIFFDHLCHASVIDGIKISSARFFSFDHNNMTDLEDLLKKKRSFYKKAFIVTEGIFSMDGDAVPLKQIVDLAEKWKAATYLDEAHSIGVVGPEGKGLAAQEHLTHKIDILVGTLSKTLGTQGGFVAAHRDIVDFLISRSRSFIYTTALAPACAAAAMAALELVPTVDDRRRQVNETSSQLREALKKMGFSTLTSESQIIPVLTGDVAVTKRLSDHLFSHGFFVPSIRPPTVPVGQGRVRLSMAYDAVKEGIEKLTDAFKQYSLQLHQKGESVAKIS